jgi:uncharacterized Rmd1/YagE family protein
MVKVVCFVIEQTVILKQQTIEELKRMDVGVARRSQMMTVEMNVDTTVNTCERIKQYIQEDGSS